jgi:hypothetical protein
MMIEEGDILVFDSDDGGWAKRRFVLQVVQPQ